MELAISEHCARLLDDFARCINGTIEFASLKVIVRSFHISIVFLQLERYPRLVGCHVLLSQDVSFLFEDVVAAYEEPAALSSSDPPKRI